ncbi:MAG: bifunctional UDP-N-acetylglucosamine diphosphorylase/glucosamine-1-phosphate N-acetyltransferase GlmU [Gammaproteobacteria bacterium]|jgi:bifunctional UDP-N-acetylglucosamine pyrophosphorylase / glucosamine-1-phosphate N-acetyltransferase
MKTGVVILAAGQGTRMKSALPKVLHPLAGKPMLQHVIETAQRLDPETIVVVYGHGGELVRERMQECDVEWALQAEQLGTGHAVQQAMPLLREVDQVLVLYGDVPLIRASTLERLVEASAETRMGMLTVELEEPTGYGRIIRDEYERIIRVVEQKDASAEELHIHEINAGIMLIGREELGQWLAEVRNDNAQNEYYLPDIIPMAVGEGHVIASVHPDDLYEVEGINDRVQLSRLERVYQSRQAESLMRAGATLIDPARLDIRGSVSVGQDVVIEPNVILEGNVELGDGVHVGANNVLRDVVVGSGCRILENCVIEQAIIGQACQIGPFARVRPGTELAERVRIGNFVETKNAQIAEGSKVNHLSYIGDTTMGRDVNVGAGTITCNYDGAYKHRTLIGDNAFIGSNTQIVAPVTIEAGATIGAGSTITKTAPAGKLTLCRTTRQTTIANWVRPTKKRENH